MIQEQISQLLINASSSENFCFIAKQHGLLARHAEGIAFKMVAYSADDYAGRVFSPLFCSACGTSDLPSATHNGESLHCVACHYKFYQVDISDMVKAIDQQPCSMQDLPDYVIAGELFDDRLAMYLNEY